MKGLVMVMIWVCATLINSDVGDGAGDTLTWNVGDAMKSPSGYNVFIDSLRRMVLTGSTQKYHGVGMLPKEKTPPSYVLVVLESNEPGKTITLSLEVSSLYLVGYSEMVGTKCLYHSFRGLTHPCENKQGKRCRLCEGKNVVEFKEIPYKFDYASLEIKAKKGREGIELIFSKLNGLIKRSNTLDETNQATFLLVAIQMVCEAARFSYIENQIVSVPNFKADGRTICLEQKWQKASKKIKDTKGDTFDEPFKCDQYDNWEAKTVAELTSCIALLCNLDNKLATNADALGSLISAVLI